MILSAGLTPAWQQILVFDEYRHGQVNRAAEVHWCASGKVLNAGIAAHTLGGPSLTLSPLGGSSGAEIRREFDDLGVPGRWISTRAAVRVCTTLLERSTGTITELVENGRPLTESELVAFRTAFAEEARRAEVAVVIGSLPFGTPPGYYRELIESARCPMVLDFRGPGLLATLELRPLIVKPNRDELAETLSRPLATDAQLIEAMRRLTDGGAKWVLVSQGSGPLWLASATSLWRFDPLEPEQVVNPIGCGDALAAGTAWGIRAGWNVPEAVALGISAAADSVRQLLPCRLDAATVESRRLHVRGEQLTEPHPR